MVAGILRALRVVLLVRCPSFLLHLTSGTVFSTPPLHSAVVWTKENPTPWNDVKPDENTKLLTVNHQFDKRYVDPLRAVLARL